MTDTVDVHAKDWGDVPTVKLPCLGGPFCGKVIEQAVDQEAFWVEREEMGTGRSFYSAYRRRKVGLKLWRWSIEAPNGKKLYYVGPGKPDVKAPHIIALDKVVETHDLWVWEQEETDVPHGADEERGGGGDAE